MSRRERALSILSAAVRAVEPEARVRAALSAEGGVVRVAGEAVFESGGGGGVHLLGAGKAAMGMARGAMAALEGLVSSATIAVPAGGAGAIQGVEVWEGGHPLPTAGSLAAAAEALRVARAARAADLVLCLLSGGASALWAAPPAGVTLAALREVTDALMRAGAGIEEVNTVRRHLSRIAGGRLARAAAPARVVTLALSDVLDAPPQAIGSGPTQPDPSTFEEALEVLARRGVREPREVLRHLQGGATGEAEESAKPGELDGSSFHLVGGLRDALDGARAEAERLGYSAAIVSDRMTGEARAVGAEIASFALQASRASGERRAFLWGGETTVTVRGEGRGGRNQELALSAARMMNGFGGITLLACGTDGIDGPTPAAGGLVDGGTVGRARAAGLDPDAALSRNDSHPFLRAAGDLVVTGPTGTNVGDLVVALVE